MELSAEAAPGSSIRGELGRTELAASRFRTRSRLVVALAALAAMLLGAVLLQFAGLRQIAEDRAAAEDLEERFLLAVQLENALQRQFAHQPLAAQGHAIHSAAYRDARRDVAALASELAASLRDVDAASWVAAIADAARCLHEDAQSTTVAVVERASLVLASDETSSRLFEVETNLTRLFASLGSATAAHRETVARGEDALRRLAIGLVLATALLAVALTLYLSRFVVRPLATLEAGAARLATGHLETPIDIRSRDEFGVVAAQLNLVAAHLQDHRERLSRAEALAAVGRSTAAVVHELNNSLQVMLGYATLGRDVVAGEVANHLQRIEHEVRRSTEIVSSVLQMSCSPKAVEFTAVDLREVADEVANGLRLLLLHGPQISVSGAGVGLGTRCRYHQIVLNLTKNAADAAGAGGRVLMQVTSTRSATHLSVEDSGPGISADVVERIVDPFFTTKAGGTGLGLSVSRSVAAALGGIIEFGRSDLGGARFTLRVPRRDREA
jgi:signal transduction histidine kinase